MPPAMAALSATRASVVSSRAAGHLGGVDDAGLDQVIHFARGGVEAVAALGRIDLGHDAGTRRLVAVERVGL
jgi:hypothetical protein